MSAGSRPWVNLQKEETDLKLDSWEDTLVVIDQLDLVITSCTSVAHVSAALEKPILPYYLWALPGNRTPWYQSVRLFRQEFYGDWTASLKAIELALTSGALKVPHSLNNCTSLRWLKVMDHELSVTEVACVLSHFALWVRCLELDQPIVILEHEAVMVQAFLDFQAYNQIVYLGGSAQARGWSVLEIHPHATLNPNYHFICRTHAYAIDPAIAKNL